MSFDEIVEDVCDRTNQRSDAAIARIGVHVNRRYRRVTASLGLVSTRRTQFPFDLEIGSRSQTITGVEKIISLTDDSSGTTGALDEITYEEMLTRVPADAPRAFAVLRYGARQVTVLLDFEPQDDYTIGVEGKEVATNLADDQEPGFPESFHDILVFGALADEYRKMDKIPAARDAEADFERILSELRLHIAVSGYLDIVQGKNNRRRYTPTRTGLML